MEALWQNAMEALAKAMEASTKRMSSLEQKLEDQAGEIACLRAELKELKEVQVEQRSKAQDDESVAVDAATVLKEMVSMLKEVETLPGDRAEQSQCPGNDPALKDSGKGEETPPPPHVTGSHNKVADVYKALESDEELARKAAETYLPKLYQKVVQNMEAKLSREPNETWLENVDAEAKLSREPNETWLENVDAEAKLWRSEPIEASLENVDAEAELSHERIETPQECVPEWKDWKGCKGWSGRHEGQYWFQALRDVDIRKTPVFARPQDSSMCAGWLKKGSYFKASWMTVQGSPMLKLTNYWGYVPKKFAKWEDEWQPSGSWEKDCPETELPKAELAELLPVSSLESPGKEEEEAVSVSREEWKAHFDKDKKTPRPWFSSKAAESTWHSWR